MDLKSPWTLTLAWLLVPLLVALACTGLGFLVARASGLRLGALTLPTGFLAGVAVMTFALEIGVNGIATALIGALLALPAISVSGPYLAMMTIAAIGSITALFAATIALRQFDLKKVFAYSTVSQLGFMFVGVGVLAPVAGVFHLVTHAFFRALLFLSSGVVMHAMENVSPPRSSTSCLAFSRSYFGVLTSLL